MTDVASRPSGQLARRLERYRDSIRRGPEVLDAGRAGPLPHRPVSGHVLAERLAETLDGEIVSTHAGTYVACEAPSRPIAIDRERLATLPGQPPATAPLLCLDTETTGLATAAGTVAFLIGLGWWEADRFRQVQLLLPHHADEPALLAALGERIAPDTWLVSYNGRGFDWPLLVTRFRMLRRAAPAHDGHLDLLPVVRRLFRHRLENARLRTAESGLLGLRRAGDVEGSEIPGRYLGFLRGGPVEPLIEVVRHNDQDVRSLAWLLVHLEQRYATPEARSAAPAGDVAGLARAFARARRLEEALECYEEALVEPVGPRPQAQPEPPWWSPTMRADFGGRPNPGHAAFAPSDRIAAFATPWTTERIACERAHLLRRLGRWGEATDAWDALAAGSGRAAVVAAIESAKLREHRTRDRDGALRVALAGLVLADRRRRLGRPEPRLEADLQRRVRRLRRRVVSRRTVGQGLGGPLAG